MGADLEVTWPQVLAWRMQRSLLDPVEQPTAVEVVQRTCGVQAQVPASAALAIGVRQTDPVAGAMDQALRDGQLLRVWAVRGTLHLLAPEDAGAYLSLMAAGRVWEKGSWVKTFGVSPEEMVELTEVVAEVLDDQILTREQLVAEVADRIGRPDLEEGLRSGWGAVLKPLAWQGVLCHGPPDGNRVTFARPDRLLPRWKGVPAPEDAARTVIPAYLRAYGPATMERFDSWLTRGASRKPMLRSWFASVEDLLVSVDVEGTPAWLMADDAEELVGTRPSPAAASCLLPGFDQYVLGPGTAAAEIIAPEHKSEVSRKAGWIAPVVVAGGRVVGVWDLDDGAVGDVRLLDHEQPLSVDALDAATDRMAAVLSALRP